MDHTTAEPAIQWIPVIMEMVKVGGPAIIVILVYSVRDYFKDKSNEKVISQIITAHEATIHALENRIASVDKHLEAFDTSVANGFEAGNGALRDLSQSFGEMSGLLGIRISKKEHDNV